MPLEGLTEVMVGTGLSIIKLREFDGPPPGAGLVTITGTTAPIGVSFAAMAAVMVVPLLETVAGLLIPLKLIVAPDTKFVPVTVNAAIPWPTGPLDGLTKVMVGTGLGLGLGLNVNEMKSVASSERGGTTVGKFAGSVVGDSPTMIQ